MSTTKRIMIIDDEIGFTRLLRLSLEATLKYTVCEENSATRALETARSFQPDLILVDVIMPEMDGGDVVAQIHADPALAKVPIIFLTATVLKEEVDARGGAIGGYPYLAKPVATKALIGAVEQALGKPASAPQA